MTLEDFHQLKISGKRGASQKNWMPQFLKKYDEELADDLSRADRSPRKGANRDHSDTDLCHICTWDVGKYGSLSLHRNAKHKSDTEEDEKNRECCGEDYPLELDHIPAASLLRVMHRRYPNEDFLSKAGYVIAVPKKLHEFVSATYQSKANNRDLKAESKNPNLALLTDIGAYFDYFRESQQMSLKILGAFRYLYRKSVKRFNKFSSQELDTLFLEAINLFLLNREENLPLNRSQSGSPVQRGVLFADAPASDDDSEESTPKVLFNRRAK